MSPEAVASIFGVTRRKHGVAHVHSVSLVTMRYHRKVVIATARSPFVVAAAGWQWLALATIGQLLTGAMSAMGTTIGPTVGYPRQSYAW